MPSAFKSFTTKDIGTSATTVYTGPAATQSTVIGMTLCNTTASSVLADVTYVKGVVTVYLARNVPVPVGGTLILIGGDQKVVVSTGDTIRVQSSVALSLDNIFSVLEIT
jgi:hypothetical protein